MIIAMHFMYCVVLGLVLPGMLAGFFPFDLLERLDSSAARHVFSVSSRFPISCSVCSSCPSFVPDRKFFCSFRPSSVIFFAPLLGGVEVHPGPDTVLRLGLLNVRSVVNKAAQIHDQISCNQLDVLVLTETHIPADALNAIKNDCAPPGFAVVHAPRFGRKKIRGGGIAVIHSTSLSVKLVDSKLTGVESCETLCIGVCTGNSRVNILAAYRPPPRASDRFFDDLARLLDNCSSLRGKHVICGDFNAPGESPETIDSRLRILV